MNAACPSTRDSSIGRAISVHCTKPAKPPPKHKQKKGTRPTQGCHGTNPQRLLPCFFLWVLFPQPHCPAPRAWNSDHKNPPLGMRANKSLATFLPRPSGNIPGGLSKPPRILASFFSESEIAGRFFLVLPPQFSKFPTGPALITTPPGSLRKPNFPPRAKPAPHKVGAQCCRCCPTSGS